MALLSVGAPHTTGMGRGTGRSATTIRKDGG